MKSFSDFNIDIPYNARGPELDTTCPKCSHTRRKKNARCLSVNIDEGVFLCHHCGWNGSLKDGEGRRFEPQQRYYAKPKIHRLTPLPEKVIAWFQARGIPESVLAQANVGWGQIYFGEMEEQAYAVQFPYYRNRELVNIKYRALPKTFRMATGAERILYGFDDIAGNKSLIWVEGEIDKLSMEVADLSACVSVPDGAPDAKSRNYESKFDFLESAEAQLVEVQEHILAVDNDANGRRLEEELARRLGVEKCRRVTWPDGCKDANDVLAKHGADRLAQCIIQAEPYPVSGLITVDAIEREVWTLYEEGPKPGLSTGYQKLDKFYTIKDGQITVGTGVPSHGKTSFFQDLAVNLARDHGWRFAIFSPEDQPLARLVTMLIQRKSAKTITPGHPQHIAADDFAKVLQWVKKHFYIIAPDDSQESSLTTILDLARIAVLRHGIKGLMIDPWNELEHARPRELTETEYISQSLRRVRQFARAHKVHVWIIAHPTKMHKVMLKDGTEGYPVPTLYDISGSSNWRNKADCGLVVYRPSTDECDDVEIHVQKVRFREVGKPGMVKLHYHQMTGRFSEIGG